MKILLVFLFSIQALAESSSIQENILPMTFVKIPPGTFVMGTTFPTDRVTEPPHNVTLSHAFEFQITPVTQFQWLDVMTKMHRFSELYPAHHKNISNCPNGFLPIYDGGICPNHPVENINWFQAIAFANAVSYVKGFKPCYDEATHEPFNKSIYNCNGYRLPTEAEWEYAARAGTTTPFFFGQDSSLLQKFSIYKFNNPGGEEVPQPAEVGTVDSNPWGIYDVLGNVGQWVHDSFGALTSLPIRDPEGPRGGGLDGVVRGGSYYSPPVPYLYSWYRRLESRDWSNHGVGLRLARTVK